MNQTPQLTDRAALSRNRCRTSEAGLFLHQIAADEVKDRLSEVNKTFNACGLVTGHAGFWEDAFPDAHVTADTDALPLAADSYDLILHAMALHWADDPVGQLIQCRRALRPDGLFIAVAFGGQTLAELRAALGQAESDITGGLSPRVAPMADLQDLGALLQRANFALPVADLVSLNVEYDSIWHLMRDLRSMGEGNALHGRLRQPTRKAVFDRAATLYADHFMTPDGRVTATFELMFLTGWAPHSDQPQPLRPGSAQQRLADALGTKETPLRD